jgi:hypothetical protein
VLPGRFLGIARTTGDTFTFIIETDNRIRNVSLHRSVIKRRDPKIRDPYAQYDRGDITIDEPQSEGSETQHVINPDVNQSIGDEPGTPPCHDEVIISEPTDISPSIITHASDGEHHQEHVPEVYDHFGHDIKCSDITEITGAKFDELDGKLYIQVVWIDGRESMIDAKLLQVDDPLRLTRYITDNPVERLRYGFWSQWATKTLHSISKAAHRIRRLYHTNNPKDSIFPHSRRVIRRKKVYPLKMQSFMGIAIPRNTREALNLDKINKDGLWKGAIQKEVDGIKSHGRLLFLPPGASPPEGYQEAPLRVIFDIKPDLRKKARIVAGGHKVNAEGHSSYSSVVKLESIRLLNVIAKAQNLQVLAGDVGNAYLNADTKEKVYTICGPVFGPELEGRIAIIKRVCMA